MTAIYCLQCCRPRGHSGDCCALCLERHDDRRRSCTSKKSYSYLSDAQTAADMTGLFLKVYRCRYEPHWHVGHRISK